MNNDFFFNSKTTCYVKNAVRQKAKDIVDFIQDDDRLREERKKAKKNKDKYIGMSGEQSNFRNSYSKYFVQGLNPKI